MTVKIGVIIIQLYVVHPIVVTVEIQSKRQSKNNFSDLACCCN